MWLDQDSLSVIFSFLHFFQLRIIVQVSKEWNEVAMRCAKWESLTIHLALHNGRIPRMASHLKWIHFSEWSSREDIQKVVALVTQKRMRLILLIGLGKWCILQDIRALFKSRIVVIYLFQVSAFIPSMGKELQEIHVDELSYLFARFGVLRAPCKIHCHAEGDFEYERDLSPQDARMEVFQTLTIHRAITENVTRVFDLQDVLVISSPLVLPISFGEISLMRLRSKFRRLEKISWVQWRGRSLHGLRNSIHYLMKCIPTLKSISIKADVCNEGYENHVPVLFEGKPLNELIVHFCVRKWIDFSPDIHVTDVHDSLSCFSDNFQLLSFSSFECDAAKTLDTRKVCPFVERMETHVFFCFLVWQSRHEFWKR